MSYHPRTHPRGIRVAGWVIGLFGTVAATLFILIVTLVWIGWNTFGPSQYRFDPSPSFFVLLLLMNIISIVMQPLILVSNNLQEAANQKRFEDLSKHVEALTNSIPNG